MATKKAKVAKPKDVSKEITVKNDKVALIDLIIERFAKKDCKWTKTGENDVLTTKTEKTGQIIITFPEDFDGDFKISYDDKGKIFFDEMVALEKMDIFQKDVDDSVFGTTSIQEYKDGYMSSLGKNITVFNEMNEWFKKLGFEEVYARSGAGYNLNEAGFTKLTLVMEPDFNSAVSTNTDGIVRHYQDMDGFKQPSTRGKYFKTITGEKSVEMKLHGKNIGRYYPERNLMLLFFNIFGKINLKSAETFKSNKYLAALTADLETVIKELGMKKSDSTDFIMKLTVMNFNKDNRSRLKDLESKHKSYDTQIRDYETKLTSSYRHRVQLADEIKVLSLMDGDKIDMFIKEIEKAKNCPLVTNVELTNGALLMTFKETTLKSPMVRDVSGDNSGGDIKEFFIGAITVHLTGSGVTKVSCSHPGPSGKPHPHANESGSPCLGSGDGPNAMHKLIGERKFADFAYVFWMWIKRWRPEDCYIKPHDYYDDRIRKGLPVFDQVGNRLELNDEKRIKSGDQIKLKKDPSFKENYEKYKDFKPIK